MDLLFKVTEDGHLVQAEPGARAGWSADGGVLHYRVTGVPANETWAGVAVKLQQTMIWGLFTVPYVRLGPGRVIRP